MCFTQYTVDPATYSTHTHVHTWHTSHDGAAINIYNSVKEPTDGTRQPTHKQQQQQKLTKTDAFTYKVEGSAPLAGFTNVFVLSSLFVAHGPSVCRGNLAFNSCSVSPRFPRQPEPLFYSALGVVRRSVPRYTESPRMPTHSVFGAMACDVGIDLWHCPTAATAYHHHQQNRPETHGTLFYIIIQYSFGARPVFCVCMHVGFCVYVCVCVLCVGVCEAMKK